MLDYSYLEEIFKKIGVIINDESQEEIIYYYPLVFDEKSLTYYFKSSYSIIKQPLGTFFTDFLKTNFDDFEEFKNLFFYYPFVLITNEYIKLSNMKPFSINDFHNWIIQIYQKKKKLLIRIQEQLDEILDYCIINPRNRKVNFSALDRFLVLQYVHENLTLFRHNKVETFTFYTIPHQTFTHKSEDTIYKLLEENTPVKHTVIIPSTLEALLYFVLCKIIENEIQIKICKNCGNYFISNNTKISYCNNIAPDSDKTCKKIGSSKTFHTAVNNDNLLKKYYHLYSKKCMLSRRNPDIQEYVKDFNDYKKYGKNKVMAYKSNKLSAKDFEIWLNKKDK